MSVTFKENKSTFSPFLVSSHSLGIFMVRFWRFSPFLPCFWHLCRCQSGRYARQKLSLEKGCNLFYAMAYWDIMTSYWQIQLVHGHCVYSYYKKIDLKWNEESVLWRYCNIQFLFHTIFWNQAENAEVGSSTQNSNKPNNLKGQVDVTTSLNY